MTASLSRMIGASTTQIRLVDAPTLAPPFHGRLDEEIVIVASFLERNGGSVIARGQFATIPRRHAAGTELVELTWPDGTKRVDDGRLALFGSGPPDDGPAGTGALVAASGSQYTDVAEGVIHVNVGSAESPTWRRSGNTGSGSGDDKTFAHHQYAAAATWPVVHNLGKLPAVTVVDSAGSQVIGDVVYLDRDQLEVHFSAPFSGVAVCN